MKCDLCGHPVVPYPLLWGSWHCSKITCPGHNRAFIPKPKQKPFVVRSIWADKKRKEPAS